VRIRRWSVGAPNHTVRTAGSCRPAPIGAQWHRRRRTCPRSRQRPSWAWPRSGSDGATGLPAATDVPAEPSPPLPQATTASHETAATAIGSARSKDSHGVTAGMAQCSGRRSAEVRSFATLAAADRRACRDLMAPRPWAPPTAHRRSAANSALRTTSCTARMRCAAKCAGASRSRSRPAWRPVCPARPDTTTSDAGSRSRT
jgi:hypothetical protein